MCGGGGQPINVPISVREREFQQESVCFLVSRDRGNGTMNSSVVLTAVIGMPSAPVPVPGGINE